MAGYEVLDRETAVTARGAAVNNNEVDGTHGDGWWVFGVG
jgi:hypothetical protein